MARKPIHKETKNSRLLKEYASWIYCTTCNKTVAYLCYVTYNSFEFDYSCNCGSHGAVSIQFEHDPPVKSSKALILVKNRLCCPKDNAPLFSVIEKNIKTYSIRVVCSACNTEYIH